MNKKIVERQFGVKDIAELAGVSIATVDRVLNNRKGVSMQTKDKILKIIKENNYQPNLHARSLSIKKTFNFAVLIPQTSEQTGYWQLCLDGINSAIEELVGFGIHIEVFLYDQEHVSTFNRHTADIFAKNFDAVVIAPIFIEETKRFVESCQERSMETIFINSDIPDQSSLGYIGPDLTSTGQLAANLTSYLVPEHAHILVLNLGKGLENYKYLDTKIAGYTDYLQGLNKNIQLSNVNIPFNDFDEIEIELIKRLKDNDYDLVFVTNSRVSFAGEFFEKHPEYTKPYIIGFDFLPPNVTYLAKGIVDFLICQRPDKQGYLALNYLYRYFLMNKNVKKFKPMPIDILTKENYLFYEN